MAHSVGSLTALHENVVIKPYHSFKSITLYITTCLSIALLFSPFYSGRSVTEDINTSPLAAALINSSVLQIVYISGFASSFSPILDVALDLKFGFANVDSIERICIIISLIIPSCLFLLLRGSTILPHIYWNIRSAQLIVKATACASVMNKLFPTNFPMRITLPILTLYAFNFIFRGFATANNNYSWAVFAYLACHYLVIILYISVMLAGFRVLFKKQVKSTFESESIGPSEYMASLYGLIPMIYGICGISIANATGLTDLNRADETILVTFQLIDIIFTVLLGYLPNQIARKANQSMNCKLLDLKRTFVRYVSHEIRSPLNVVDAGLDVLTKELSGQFDSEDVLETIKDISDSAAMAISILNDLLNYEHIDAGTFKLELEEIPVTQVFGGHNNVDHLQMLAKSRAVELQIHNMQSTRIKSENQDSPHYQDLESPPPHLHTSFERTSSFSRESFVNIDIYRLSQVIRNLVTNAIKFCPREEGLVVVTIKADMDVKDVSTVPLAHAKLVGILRVEVKDNGAGIAPENLSKVFGEFSQVEKNKLQGGGGSGLGLWISRRIIQLHGGTLNFTSEGIGKGCTFYFCLPVYETQDHESNPEFEKLIPSNFGYLMSSSAKVEPADLSANSSYSMHRNTWSKHSSAIGPDTAVPGLYSQNTASGSTRTSNTVSTVALRGGSYDNAEAVQLRDVEHTGRGDAPPLQLKILIVDDSALNRKFTDKIILTEPQAIPNPILIHADDGDIAVDLIRASIEEKAPFHLVLMDSVMTNMHGPKAVKILRTEYNYTGIVIGVTGNALPDDINSFIRQGVDHVLTKPLKRQRLLDLMRSEGLISGGM